MTRLLWTVVAVIATSPSLHSVQDTEKSPIRIADYGLWRSVTSTAYSEKGDWAAFAYAQREKDPVLHIRQLEGDKKYEVPRGSAPAFSDDSSWVAYFLNPPVGKEGESSEEKKPEVRKVELLNLATGARHAWDRAASFAFSRGSAVLVVKKQQAPGQSDHKGSNLLLRRLVDGAEELLGSVESHEFNRPGTHLAYTVSATDKDGNGVYLLELSSGSRRALDAGKAAYSRLTWSEEGIGLAVLKGVEAEGYTEIQNTLLIWQDALKPSPKKAELNAKEAFGFPKDMVISEKATLQWAEPPTRVFFGIKSQGKKPDKKKGVSEAEKIANVDIWHYRDERLQSVQMVRANGDRNRTDRAVFHPTGAKPFVRLTDESMRSIEISRDGRWGIGRDGRSYVSDWKQRRVDLYRVDLETGERTLVIEGLLDSRLGLSPASTHFLLWRDGHVWALNLQTMDQVNLTEHAAVSFVNQEFDRFGEKPSYGVAGWTADGESVVLHHRYDLWQQPLDGTAATNLTGGVGAEQEIRFRYVRTDPDERFLDPSKPWLLSAYGQWTKKSGFYGLHAGKLEEKLFLDRSIGRLSKARRAEQYFFTIQSFEEFPDLYTCTGTFQNPRRLTDANPQQVGYLWGRRVLFDYENKDGVRLQGTLAIPERHVEGQKLPMLVNFYEKNSQNLHRYPTPRYSSGPQFAGYVSNGYLVMQPDIHFRTGRSHSDMQECVEAAVAKVLEMGYADPARVGLHGHSYSGQGAAFIATRSKLFAAVVAGAAATNLVSDFNQLWKSAGSNQHGYDIHGQGRFGTNPYDDLELFMDQSAVSHVRNMDVPLLLLHGTEDGAVEWLQAVEFYNALRFNDKYVILLSYPGEGHGLRKFENQKDFQTRMRDFFDHHLRDKAAPEWMTRGVPFLEKERRLKEASGKE